MVINGSSTAMPASRSSHRLGARAVHVEACRNAGHLGGVVAARAAARAFACAAFAAAVRRIRTLLSSPHDLLCPRLVGARILEVLLDALLLVCPGVFPGVCVRICAWLNFDNWYFLDSAVCALVAEAGFVFLGILIENLFDGVW